jgi:hypothetical protein
MAELALAVSVLTIADVAYHSSKKLFEVVGKYKKASKTLVELHVDLDTVQTVLQDLTKTLGDTNDASLSDGVKNCFRFLKPSMEACSKACDEFAAKLEEITSNSTETHLSPWDKVRLQREEPAFAAFKYRLGSHKSTITIVLGLVTM